MARLTFTFILTFLFSCYCFGQVDSDYGKVSTNSGYKSPDFLKPPFARRSELYIGKARKDSINEFVYAIEFKIVDTLTIDYKVTKMVNWQNPNDIVGMAKLDLQTLGSDKILLTDRAGNRKTAYRFVDLTDVCNLEIIITKDSLITESSAQAFRYCKGKIDSLTTPLHHK